MAYEGTQIDSDGKRRKISDETAEPVYEDIPKAEARADEPAPEVQDEQEGPETNEDSANKEDEGGEEDEFPRHVGGGTYELRSGARVKGKTEALEAQIEEDEG